MLPSEAAATRAKRISFLKEPGKGLLSPNHSLLVWTGAPCSPQRTWAENGVFQMLSLHARGFLLLAALFARATVTLKGAAPCLFRPMYAGANMGTRPGKRAMRMTSRLIRR